jgi:hypothetical protein
VKAPLKIKEDILSEKVLNLRLMREVKEELELNATNFLPKADSVLVVFWIGHNAATPQWGDRLHLGSFPILPLPRWA